MSGAVIKFPSPPLRAWWVHQLPCGGWRADLVGTGIEGKRRTKIGEHHLVLSAVAHGSIRCGLPIINGPHCRLGEHPDEGFAA